MNAAHVEWRSELPATLDAIDKFCVDFHGWRDERCAGLDSFPAELLLREALTNAVMHGCSQNPTKQVWCLLRAKPGSLTIAVWDQGSGFDWRAAWDRQAGASDAGGRGIAICRRYANAVRFNARGNFVMLIKRF